MIPSQSRDLMRRELAEQPGMLAAAAVQLGDSAAAIRPAQDRPVWIGGCGDSLFAAQAIAPLFRARGWDVRPCSAAELLWDAPVRTGDAVVCLSISGSTRRTVEALAAARVRGAHTIAVTLTPGSALAQAAETVLTLPYTPISRAIPHGLDYHVTLLALAALAGPVDGAALQGLMEDLGAALPDAARAIAADLPSEPRFFFLGCGGALGSANFGAAKMHEAGGLPAWSFEAENFTHGAQFMLRPGDHVVLCGAGTPGDARTAALRPGLERLGASVSTAGLGSRGADPLGSALRAAVWGQALCLAVADALDLDVTDPARGSAAGDVQQDWFGWQAG